MMTMTMTMTEMPGMALVRREVLVDPPTWQMPRMKCSLGKPRQPPSTPYARVSVRMGRLARKVLRCNFHATLEDVSGPLPTRAERRRCLSSEPTGGLWSSTSWRRPLS